MEQINDLDEIRKILEMNKHEKPDELASFSKKEHDAYAELVASGYSYQGKDEKTAYAEKMAKETVVSNKNSQKSFTDEIKEAAFDHAVDFVAANIKDAAKPSKKSKR